MSRLRHLYLALLLCLAALPLTAAQPDADDPYADYDEAVYMDMDLEENIETPALLQSDKHDIRTYMRHMADDFARRKYVVELDRDDEVMVVVVTLDHLFSPNDTLMARRGPAYLKPLLEPLKDPDMFKLVYVVHSDNTGSEKYNYDLSQTRVNTVYDWLLDNIPEDVIVIPFAMGDMDPIASNESRRGRAENRRIEFYYVPGPKMITLARKKALLK